MRKVILPLFILPFLAVMGNAASMTVSPTLITGTVEPNQTIQGNVTITLDTVGTSAYVEIHPFFPYFASSISPSTIISTNDSSVAYPFTYHVTIPPYFPPGTYTGNISIPSSNLGTANVGLVVNVTEITDFSVPVFTRVEASCGLRNSTFIEVANLGNVEANLSVAKSGTMAGMVRVPDSFPLYTQSVRRLYIDYETPENAVGENVLVLNLTAGGVTRTALLNFTVTDDTLPVVSGITVPEDVMATVRFPVDAKASDNIDVDRVIMDVECSGYSENNIDMERNGPDVWRAYVTLGRPSDCTAKVWVYDQANNTASLNRSFEVGFMTEIALNEELRFPQAKLRSEVEKLIFKTNHTIENLTVRLKELDFSANITNGSYFSGFEVIVGTDREDKDIEHVGESVFFEKIRDEFFLWIKSREVTSYEGLLELEFPESVVERNPVEVAFVGKISDYEIHGDWEGYVYGLHTECEPIDRGTYESSALRCCIDYRPDTDPEELTVYVREYDRTQLERACSAEKREIQSDLSVATGWVGALWVMFIFSVLAYIWKVYVSPNLLILE